MTARIRLQPLTRARVASLGDAGARWVDRLPRVLAELAGRWSLTLGRGLPGGSASYVVAARTAVGDERVVKVLVPDGDLADESRVLGPADGHGYVRLHAHDAERRALLLERLGTSLEHTPLPPEEKLRVLAATLREAWRLPLEHAPAVAPGEDRASVLHRLITDLDRRLDHAAQPRAVEHALRLAERLAADFDPAACVVAHGDPHPANALRLPAPRPGGGSGYVFVDPDGVRADPAYDAGVALRDWSGRLRGPDARGVLEGYARVLADGTGLPEQRIWDWGFVERVSTGLYVTSFGAPKVGAPLLETAGALV